MKPQKGQNIKCSLFTSMFILKVEPFSSQLPTLKPAGLNFMAVYTTRIPNTRVLSGGAAPSRD